MIVTTCWHASCPRHSWRMFHPWTLAPSTTQPFSLRRASSASSPGLRWGPVPGPPLSQAPSTPHARCLSWPSGLGRLGSQTMRGLGSRSGPTSTWGPSGLCWLTTRTPLGGQRTAGHWGGPQSFHSRGSHGPTTPLQQNTCQKFEIFSLLRLRWGPFTTWGLFLGSLLRQSRQYLFYVSRNRLSWMLCVFAATAASLQDKL